MGDENSCGATDQMSDKSGSDSDPQADTLAMEDYEKVLPTQCLDELIKTGLAENVGDELTESSLQTPTLRPASVQSQSSRS